MTNTYGTKATWQPTAKDETKDQLHRIILQDSQDPKEDMEGMDLVDINESEWEVQAYN